MASRPAKVKLKYKRRRSKRQHDPYLINRKNPARFAAPEPKSDKYRLKPGDELSKRKT